VQAVTSAARELAGEASLATHLASTCVSASGVLWLMALTLRRLMSYIYMEHPFLMFLDHTQRRSTVGRTPLDE